MKIDFIYRTKANLSIPLQGSSLTDITKDADRVSIKYPGGTLLPARIEKEIESIYHYGLPVHNTPDNRRLWLNGLNNWARSLRYNRDIESYFYNLEFPNLFPTNNEEAREQKEENDNSKIDLDKAAIMSSIILAGMISSGRNYGNKDSLDIAVNSAISLLKLLEKKI